MTSKETTLQEIVRVACLASGGDPALLHQLARLLLREAEKMENAAFAAESAADPAQAEYPDSEQRQRVSARIALAEKLATRMDAPSRLMLDFACSEIEIARPVLEKSPVLSQEELADIIFRQSREHVMAVASRWDIGPELADALLAYGNDDVIDVVLRNEAVTLSPKSFSSLAKRAANSVRIQNGLLARNDLPVDVICELLEKLVGDQKARLLGKLIRVDPVDAAQRFEIPKKTRQSRRFLDAEQLAERLVRRRGVDENILVELAAQKKQLELLLCCSKLFGLDLDSTLGVLSDPSGLSLATLCRAKELSVNTFSQISVTPVAGASTDGTRVRALLHYYKRLSVGDAVKAVALWRDRHKVAENAVVNEIAAGAA